MQVIREREPKDLPALFEVFSQPRCREAMSGPDFPSREALGAWLDAAALQGVTLVGLEAERAVAFAGLYRGGAERRHVVLVARLDNLGKGASGAAVQNLELMLGL